MEMKSPSPCQILAYARKEAENCLCVNSSWEVNTTQLAENTAHHFDNDHWLDDSEHYVWEAAAQAGEEYEESQFDE